MTRALPAAVAIALLAAPAATAAPGDWDRRFGNRGAVTSVVLDGGWAGTLDGRGRILVAGGLERPGVVRLTAGGRRDRRFGVRQSDHRDLQAFGIRRGRDGIVRVAAFTSQPSRPPVEILRFGRRGRPLSARVHGETFLGPIVGGVQRPDGGAYVLSWSGEIRAVLPNGRLDTSFGGGTVDLRRIVGDGYWPTGGLALRRDGSLLATGGTPILYSGSDRRVLVQLRPDGTLDPRFGDGGVARTPFAAQRIHLVRGGDVIGTYGGQPLEIFRVTPRGLRRRGFGDRFGIVRARRRLCCAEVADVVADRRGRLYALTGYWDRGTRIAVFSFTRRGALRRRFGDRGAAVLPERSRRRRRDRPRPYDVANDLVLDGRGGLLLVGTRFVDGTQHPSRGCGYREDFCASTVALRMWRLHL